MLGQSEPLFDGGIWGPRESGGHFPPCFRELRAAGGLTFHLEAKEEAAWRSAVG